MNLFSEIFRIVDGIIRLIGDIVPVPFGVMFFSNVNQVTSPLVKLQSFLGILVLLMPAVSLVICKIVKEYEYSIKTKVWLFTLFLPIIYVPLRYFISQVYFYILDNPTNPILEKFSSEFFTYCIIQLIIAVFAFLLTFKGIKRIGRHNGSLTSKLLTSCNENVEERNLLRNITTKLVQLMNIDMPEILVLKLENPILFTVDGGKKKALIVASIGLIELLDRQELEACLGHELAHIMNKDSSVRRISSFLRAAMFYNPLGYFIESTIYCEREFLADMMCSRITKKPEALASALIKIAENTKDSGSSLVTQKVLCFFKSYKFLLKKHPPLEERLKRLVRMAENKDLL
mgnify:CR=1 FL=1